MRAWRSWPELGLPVAQAVMEALPIHALLQVLTTLAPGAVSLSLPQLAGLQVGSVLLARFSLRWALPLGWQRLGLLGAAMLFWLSWLHLVIAPHAGWAPRAWLRAITTPSELGLPLGGLPLACAWIASVYVAARGLLLGVREPASDDSSDAAHWYSVGAIILVLLSAILARAGLGALELPGASLRDLTVSYFVLGACVTAFDQRQRVYAREGLRAPRSLAFVVALALPLICVVSVGLFLVDGMPALRSVGRMFAEFMSVLAGWAWQLALSIAYGLQLVLYWLGQLGRSGGSEDRARPGSGEVPDLPEFFRARHAPKLHIGSESLPVLAAALCVVMLGFFLLALFRRRSAARTEPVQEESVSLWSLALLGQQLLGLFRAAVVALQAKRDELLAHLSLQPTAATPSERLHDLRAVYRALLRWAEVHGSRRAPATTPLEFARQLSGRRERVAREIFSLTRYYDAARYGERPHTQPELDDAKQLLHSVETSDDPQPRVEA